MQMARVGDIPGMEKLFAEGEYDATYTDDENITPLHVGAPGHVLGGGGRTSANGLVRSAVGRHQ
jgi:hypothetical protein